MTRPHLIRQSASSALSSGASQVLVAAPKELIVPLKIILEGLAVTYLADDPLLGLGEKISRAFNSFPESIRFLAWLGDDDILLPESLLKLRQMLIDEPKASLAYGDCQYISSDGQDILTNKAGKKASRILAFGPQLIPQPSTLFRRKSFILCGGIKSNFELAFDFEFFLAMKKVGIFTYSPFVVSKFRWHPDSLSVKRRWDSVNEASIARIRNYHPIIRPFMRPWEEIVKRLTYWAGYLLTRKIRKQIAKNSSDF